MAHVKSVSVTIFNTKKFYWNKGKISEGNWLKWFYLRVIMDLLNFILLTVRGYFSSKLYNGSFLTNIRLLILL